MLKAYKNWNEHDEQDLVTVTTRFNGLYSFTAVSDVSMVQTVCGDMLQCKTSSKNSSVEVPGAEFMVYVGKVEVTWDASKALKPALWFFNNSFYIQALNKSRGLYCTPDGYYVFYEVQLANPEILEDLFN